MRAAERSASQKVRAQLKHPVIDSDGHTLEFEPAFLEYLREIGGPKIVEQYDRRNVDRSDESPEAFSAWHASTPRERAEKRLRRTAWWGLPAKNTLDRATSILPKLLYERLDEMGLDFTILYPSLALTFAHLNDEDMRIAACRAHNTYQADIFREYSDRIAPVAVVPLHTPAEAIAELEYAVGKLGMKSVLMPSYVLRPRADGKGTWYDVLCIDSPYDYDPVWAKCVELGVAPSFHSKNQGIGTRNSISSYVYNHIGHFAASSEALCKAAFLGGVTRRFPDLRMTFLEGGVGWACELYSALIGHWEKRGRRGIGNYDPSSLDQDLFWELHARYGGKMVEGRLADERNRRRALYVGDPNFSLIRIPGDPGPVDEFAACGIEKAEDIKDLFVPNFAFGCEADDPITAWAFDTKKNPFGARLRAVFGSDIGHWDVPDMSDVTHEAWEMVEHELIDEADFRAFVCDNPLRMLVHANPNFFKGTVIEKYARDAGANA